MLGFLGLVSLRLGLFCTITDGTVLDFHKILNSVNRSVVKGRT